MAFLRQQGGRKNENENPTSYGGGDLDHLVDNYAEFKIQRLSVAGVRH